MWSKETVLGVRDERKQSDCIISGFLFVVSQILQSHVILSTCHYISVGFHFCRCLSLYMILIHGECNDPTWNLLTVVTQDETVCGSGRLVLLKHFRLYQQLEF